MIDKLRALSMLVLATAALIGALAALVFVLRGGDARAEPTGSGRYQLATTYAANKYVVLDIIDTSSGRIWELDGPNDDWGPISKQFEPTKK